ncbi:hypothetical protein [Maribacter aurantiacus]|uniref:hypothetical protein n=1 Tax=Maribacter aurantiacus TaxID=1882343 RepID=UPI0013761C4E|nr:hypothetical protein [Maribacter aurantiacus]
MKWFKLFGLKRKLKALCPYEGFFEIHSWAMEQEKDEIWVQFCDFLASFKSLNHFND